MKLNIRKLVKGKYYKLSMNDNSIKYYYKFKEYDGSNISTYGYFIESSINGVNYKNSNDNISINWYNFCEISEEVSFEFIVNYLPDNDPDKKAYLRKGKIDFLLNK